MRDLGRVPEGERLVAGQPARQAAARLHRRVRLAALVEAHLDHPVGGAQGGLDVAVGEDALVRAIRRDRLVDPRQAGILGVLGIDDGRERGVLDVDERAGVLDLVAVLADHAGDEVADEADLVRRQGRHLHRQEPLDRRRDPQRRRRSRQVATGQHRRDARRPPRGVDVDPADPRMGVRAAHEGGVKQARRRQVADVAAAPEDQLLRLARAQRRADVPLSPLAHVGPRGEVSPGSRRQPSESRIGAACGVQRGARYRVDRADPRAEGPHARALPWSGCPAGCGHLEPTSGRLGDGVRARMPELRCRGVQQVAQHVERQRLEPDGQSGKRARRGRRLRGRT